MKSRLVLVLLTAWCLAGGSNDAARHKEAYWKKAGQKDALGLARQFRAASLRIEAAAKAARFDQALQAYGNLAATCRACHDLHPEKRLAPNPR